MRYECASCNNRATRATAALGEKWAIYHDSSTTRTHPLFRVFDDLNVRQADYTVTAAIRTQSRPRT